MGETERLILLFATFLFWGGVVYAILEWRKMKHKAQMQNKIIDKFSGVQELNDFLKGDTGIKFMNYLTIKGGNVKEKIISSIKKGLILLSLGISLLVVGPFFTRVDSEVSILKGISIIIIVVGIGYLVSTLISYLLSKKWGLFDAE